MAKKKLLTWIRNKKTGRSKTVKLGRNERPGEDWIVVYREGILDSGDFDRLDGDEHWKRLFGDLNQ